MDVSIEVDKATGLPALPEGYFWRVGYSELSIMRNAPAGKWSDWGIELTWRGDREWESQRRVVLRGVTRFTRRPIMVEEFRYRRAAGEAREFGSRYGEWGGDWRYPVCIEGDPMTRENLYDRACDVYYEWQQKRETDALVGDYPPKVFTS